MSHPLDDLYSRLLDNWQRDPSTLDNPLLARAFEAAEPNRSLQDRLEQVERGLGAEQERYNALKASAAKRLAELTRALDDAHAQIDHLKRTGPAKLKAAQKRVKELEHDLAPPQPVKTQEGEAEQLANLGWRKGT